MEILKEFYGKHTQWHIVRNSFIFKIHLFILIGGQLLYNIVLGWLYPQRDGTGREVGGVQDGDHVYTRCKFMLM